MEEIKITRKMEKKMEAINSGGSEGIVYKYNNQAIKIFKSNYMSLNKLKKIKILKNMEMEHFQLPQEVIINKVFNPIGYTMDYVDFKTDVSLLLDDKRLTVRQKLLFLNKTEELLKVAHNNGIVIGDMNLFNFLIDTNDDVKAIDTDNYKIGKLENDIKPDLFFPLYKKLIKDEVTEDTDKFSFMLHALKDLVGKENIDCDRMIDDVKYVDAFIDSLVIPNQLKDFVYKQLHNKDSKKYCMEYFDVLSDINEPYIKTK